MITKGLTTTDDLAIRVNTGWVYVVLSFLEFDNMWPDGECSSSH